MKLNSFSKKVRLIFTLFLFFSIVVSAQSKKKVTGTVYSTEDNTPLPGASVEEKGTKNGASTDFDGKFSLEVSNASTTLIVSYLGYKTKEVTITNSSMRITLQADVSSLNEVVVIGYGTQKITKISGAISTVKSAEIEQLKPVRAEEALQGTASGVSVIQSGVPGSKPTVLIRGIPSYSGTDPVVIIDGVPQTLGDLNAINPSDIKSLNVLKDAATTSIYGVKGGNGVIVVTTRSGHKNQKAQFTFNTNLGVQSVIKTIGVLNATEYGAIVNEGSLAAGGNIIFPDLSVLGVGTNWQDEIFKDADIISHSLSASGGSDKMSYFLSTSYLGQDGIVGGGDKSNFNRINVTANLNFNLSPKLKLILNTSYVNIKSQSVSSNSFNSIIGSALNFDPTVEIFNTVPNTIGTYGYSNLLKSEIFNPLTKLENTYNRSNGNKLYGKAELQYDVIKNLKVTSRLGYIKWDQVGKRFNPLVFYGPQNVSSTLNADGTTVAGKHNSVTEFSNSNFDFTFENFVNYTFNIKEKHNFDIVVGISVAKTTGSGFTASREDVRDNSWAWADISAATGINTATNTKAQTGSSYQNLTRKNASYFGRINYDYEGKYLASFTGRRDGSIAFGANNRFGNFYAGSLGWVATKEDFFKSDIIDFLKIRGSYGTTGNENVQPQFVSISTGGPSYGSTANSNGYTFNGVFFPGSTVNSFSNPTLRWEKQKQLNAGFDINALKRFSLTADYFEKKVDGLLFVDAPPLMAGTSLPVASNIGTTKSTGVDLTLGYNTLDTNKYKFNTSFTFTTSTNKVTATNSDGTAVVRGGSFFNGQSQSVTRFEKGFTPGYFYGWETDGLFQTAAEVASSPTQIGAVPGDIKFKDLNGDGKITDLDRTKIGDPFPNFTMGWNVNMSYKGFDLSVFTYASVGNDIYRAYERNAQFTNKFRNILDRWTGPGSTNDANNPRYTFSDANSNIRASDRYVEDGSFVKIKNVVFGYTIPKSMFASKVFTKIRVYAQIKNLYTFTNYTGYDPEIAGGILNTGIDRGAYPQARTISAGVDLKF
ncbi:TonB-dependent receptor [Lutibacter sp.]|uniref:SusC/RagA family TonB-linked outer membrane protein n=1 Tax=Lutibacter sp. TaxID=1925666 RepID=UPI0025BD2AF9|nr:TonB-dependent receptor [Lutibacter sp.]MCF6180627.1 TonB-dependent receptor [Lutibacter sp.]